MSRTTDGENMDLAGKKALITGGSNGMGFAIAQLARARGADVLITGRRASTLEVAAEQLGVHALVSDAASLPDIERLATHVRDGLDAVFLNAGYCKFNGLLDVSEREYDHTFALNTKGVFFAVQKLAPLVRTGGAIVITTSIADAVGYPGMSVYAGTKAAVRSIAQVAAAELIARGVRVNLLSPGFIKTPTMGLPEASAAENAAFVGEGEQLTPMGRIGTSEEAAKAALFLAFDATFTTGFELVIDGGMTTVVRT
ncbi:MAG TPA: SDR family oxidoreductase [Polyangiales bacterium]|nr:SDR family oxidoreductase [Polyangiales bacterium]